MMADSDSLEPLLVLSQLFVHAVILSAIHMATNSFVNSNQTVEGPMVPTYFAALDSTITMGSPFNDSYWSS